MIVSSHILGELENTADRFGIVHNGIIAREITQEDLSLKRPEIELSVSMGDLEKAKQILSENGIRILKEGFLPGRIFSAVQKKRTGFLRLYARKLLYYQRKYWNGVALGKKSQEVFSWENQGKRASITGLFR